MTLQTLNFAAEYPGLLKSGAGAPVLSNMDAMTTSGTHNSCVVLTANQDMVISHVGFKAQAATGSPTADVRIETVTAGTGIASGTLWATNTNIVTATITTTFALHALTASATITKGQQFAVVIKFQTGTTLTTGTLANLGQVLGNPYRHTNLTGSDVKATNAGVNIVLGSSTTEFYAIDNLFPAASVATNAFSNSVAGAKRGVRFQLPFKALAVGAKVYQGTAVGDYSLKLESDAGAELSSSSTAFEGDISSALATATNKLFFDNTVTLSAATWYRLMIEPSSATNVNMYSATTPGANYLKGWPGGTSWFYTTYTTAGGYVDTATDQVPLMDLLIKQLDDGGAGGGGGSGGYIISG